jgi:hypothetical protein
VADKIISPTEVVIKYEDGKKIVLDRDEAAQILALYLKQRKDNGDLFGKIIVEEGKKDKLSIFKRIDKFVLNTIERILK